MAHFAQLDKNNTVINIIVVNNEDIIDENGNESEELGIQLCKSLFEEDTYWAQTSYNHNFRGNYAVIGGSYLKDKDIFIGGQPFDSWIFNETTCKYDPPIPMPEITEEYYDCTWNEETQSWDLYSWDSLINSQTPEE